MRTDHAARIALLIALLALPAGTATAQTDADAATSPSPPVEPTEAPDDGVALPSIEGVEWLLIDAQDGAEIEAEAGEAALAAWRGILEELGSDFGDLTVETHLAADAASDADYGTVLIARVDGADPGALRAAFEAGAMRAMPPEALFRREPIAGKDVTVAIVPPSYRFVYHFDGNASYQLDLTDGVEQALLAALP